MSLFPSSDLPSFDYVIADTPQEVIRLLDKHRGTIRLMMGGTELLRQLRSRVIHPQIVLDIKHLPGIQDIVYDRQRGLMIGAAATMNQVARHPDIRTHYSLLAEAANSVGSYQIRSRATIGGNLCNASPCADTAPAVLVLEGRLVLQGLNGEREVPANEFFLGPGETAMQVDEFMRAICIPIPRACGVGRYLKLSRTRTENMSLVSTAVLIHPDQTAFSGYRLSVALGSVAPMPMRASEAERILAANPLNEETFLLAAEKAMEAAMPIDDVRASAAYRRAMIHTLTLRALREAWERLST